jgi:hypothetical protein
MKKKYILFIFVILVFNLESQSEFGFSSGPVLNFSRSNLNGLVYKSNETSIRFGLNFRTQIVENVKLGCELVYQNINFRYDSVVNSKIASIYQRNSFISIPVMIRYQSNGDKLRFFSNFGFSYNIFLGNEHETYPSVNQNFSIKNNLMNHNCFFWGAGLEYKMEHAFFSFELRHSISQRTISENQNLQVNYQNASALFSLMFSLKRNAKKLEK